MVMQWMKKNNVATEFSVAGLSLQACQPFLITAGLYRIKYFFSSHLKRRLVFLAWRLYVLEYAL